jgi:small subunit ribosomal protein S16
MQRTGRKGHAQFRVVVQDSRRTPTSGKIVAALGSYDPHTKTVTLDKEKTSFYLEHGAQPSDRAARLLQTEGVKLPGWVKIDSSKAGKLRNPEKLRRNRPDEPVVEEAPATEAAPAEEVAPEVETAETPEAAEVAAPVADAPAEEVAEAAPAEEAAEEEKPAA